MIESRCRSLQPLWEPSTPAARLTHMRNRVVAAALLVAVGGTLVACGGGSADGTDPARDRSTGGDSPTGLEPTVPPDPSKSGTGATAIRVTGTVEPGIENGCHLLTAGGTTYLLLGGQPVDGTRVEVVGTLAADQVTTCQQGVALRVETLVER
jgi:hypothetical protein